MDKQTAHRTELEAPYIKHIVKFGFMILGVFLGGFMLWGSLFPLQSASLATGKIIVESQRKRIQHLEGGIIEAIHVKEGQVVTKGDKLVSMVSEQNKAVYNLLSGRVNTLMAQEARLKAERDKLESIAFPKSLTQSNDQSVQDVLDSQQKLFETRKESDAANKLILEQRILQFNKQIESLKARIHSADMQLKFLAEEVQAMESLQKKNYIDKPRLLALQRENAKLEGTRGESLGRIAQAEQAIGETKTEILGFFKDREKEILQELERVQIELKDNKERLQATTDTLERTQIKSPVSGMVVSMNVNGPGEVIQPGQVMMEVVPDSESLIVEAYLNPVDIDMVHKGLVANVTLSAFKARNMPTIEGVVEYVSADIFEDPNQGTAFYEVKIKVDSEALKALEGVNLYPGMPVQVAIIVDYRTPLKYLISPLSDSMRKAFNEH